MPALKIGGKAVRGKILQRIASKEQLIQDFLARAHGAKFLTAGEGDVTRRRPTIRRIHSHWPGSARQHTLSDTRGQ